MRDKTTTRDERLGAALRELGAPEHAPDFSARLHSRLSEEQAARDHAAWRRRQTRHNRIRWGLRVGVVAAVTAIVVLAIGVQRDENERVPGPGVQEATAAQIRQKVRAAFATTESLSGIVVFDGFEKGDEARWRFTLTARGDFRLSGLTLSEEIAYDSETGVERSVFVEPDLTLASEVRGIAPGLPDPSPSDWLVPSEFGALVQAFLAAKDPRVKEVTYEGRPAWQLEVDATPNQVAAPGATGDHFRIVVDRRSGIPVKVTQTLEGRFAQEIRIEELAVNGELAPDAFTFEFPPDAEPTLIDNGFRRVELGEVMGIVSYAPLLPAWVPEGYELAEIAVAEKGSNTGSEASNPVSTDVVSLSYRRGLDQLLVTTRLTETPGEFPGDGAGLTPEEAWGDPLATGEGYFDEPEQITLSGGVLDGVRAELLIVPRNVPHVWALTDELVVTVSGDLSRAELLRVAESLERR